MEVCVCTACHCAMAVGTQLVGAGREHRQSRRRSRNKEEAQPLISEESPLEKNVTCAPARGTAVRPVGLPD
jgi:hypothetical protein